MTPPPASVLLRGENDSQFAPRRFAHQQESTALPILARRQPLRTGKTFALERLQRATPHAASATTNQSRPGRCPARVRQVTRCSLLEEGAPSFPAGSEGDASHVPIRMTADDVRRLARQSQEVSRFRHAELSKERAVARRDFKNTCAAATDTDHEQTQHQTGRRQQGQDGCEGRSWVVSFSVRAAPTAYSAALTSRGSDLPTNRVRRLMQQSLGGTVDFLGRQPRHATMIQRDRRAAGTAHNRPLFCRCTARG